MFHTNSILVTSIILQMKSISPPARPILITAGFPIWSINGVEHPEPDLKLENSGHTTTSNPTVITFMQTQGLSAPQYGLNKWDLCALFLTAGVDLEIVCCNLPRCLRKLKRSVDAWHKRALGGSSTFLTAKSLCFLEKIKLQRSWTLTIFIHFFFPL